MNKFMNSILNKAIIGYATYKCIGVVSKRIGKVGMEVELNTSEDINEEKSSIDYKKITTAVVGATVICSEINRRNRIKRIEQKVDDIRNILYMFM